MICAWREPQKQCGTRAPRLPTPGGAPSALSDSFSRELSRQAMSSSTWMGREYLPPALSSFTRHLLSEPHDVNRLDSFALPRCRDQLPTFCTVHT